MDIKEKERLIKQGTHLPIMEEFYTIQGEGRFTGKAAYFIRIGGCDIGCHWCDVKESWNPNMHPVKSIDQVIKNAYKYSDTVVITGGEPLTWNMKLLTEQLKKKGLQTHLETSGAYKLTGVWDWICLSPKKNKAVQENIYTQANELKSIIYNKTDFNFAETHTLKTQTDCLFYLQPEWSRKEKITPLIIDYVMKNPKWRISLQTHKYLHIP